MAEFPSALARRPPHADSEGPTPGFKTGVAGLFLLLLAVMVLLPHGEMAPSREVEVDPVTGERHVVRINQDTRWMRTLGAVLGQLSVMVLAPSLLLGLDLPILRRLSARTRLRWHVRLGKAILVLALLHTALLALRGDFRGWMPGLVSLVLLGAHGATGALKARLLRAWGFSWWRYAHRASAWGAVLAVFEHVMLASWHWGFARHFVHWEGLSL